MSRNITAHICRLGGAMALMVLLLLLVFSILPRSIWGAEPLADPFQIRLEALERSVNELAKRKQAVLLANDLRVLLMEIRTSAEIGEAIDDTRSTLTERASRGSRSDGEIVAHLPSKSRKKLQALAGRYTLLLWTRDQGPLAKQLEASLRKSAQAMRLLQSYETFAAAATDDERLEILTKLPEDVQQAVALLQPPPWTAGDEFKLGRAAQACRQLGAECLADKSEAAVEAVGLAVFVDWLQGPDGPMLIEDIKALYEAAHALYEADEADWKVVAVAAAHLEKRRYGLAAHIYNAVYSRGGEALRPVQCFAGLRLVRCDWEPKVAIRTKWNERPRTWELLQEISGRCRWDAKLEPDFLYVMRNMHPSQRNYADIVEPYYRLVMANASTLELRHEAARMLAMTFEWTSQWRKGAALYAETVHLTENAELKAYYATKSRELSQKAGSTD